MREIFSLFLGILKCVSILFNVYAMVAILPHHSDACLTFTNASAAPAGSASQARVRWEVSRPPWCQVITWGVVYNSYQPLTIYNNGPSSTSPATKELSISVLPSFLYNITIKAETGSGQVISRSLLYSAPHDVPLYPPEHFKVTSVTQTGVSLAWDQISPIYKNGAMAGYRIFYRVRGQSVVAHMDVKGENSLTTTITGLQPSTTYELKIAAVNDKGIGPLSASWERVITLDITTSTTARSRLTPSVTSSPYLPGHTPGSASAHAQGQKETSTPVHSEQENGREKLPMAFLGLDLWELIGACIGVFLLLVLLLLLCCCLCRCCCFSTSPAADDREKEEFDKQAIEDSNNNSKEPNPDPDEKPAPARELSGKSNASRTQTKSPAPSSVPPAAPTPPLSTSSPIPAFPSSPEVSSPQPPPVPPRVPLPVPVVVPRATTPAANLVSVETVPNPMYEMPPSKNFVHQTTTATQYDPMYGPMIRDFGTITDKRGSTPVATPRAISVVSATVQTTQTGGIPTHTANVQTDAEVKATVAAAETQTDVVKAASVVSAKMQTDSVILPRMVSAKVQTDKIDSPAPSVVNAPSVHSANVQTSLFKSRDSVNRRETKDMCTSPLILSVHDNYSRDRTFDKPFKPTPPLSKHSAARCGLNQQRTPQPDNRVTDHFPVPDNEAEGSDYYDRSDSVNTRDKFMMEYESESEEHPDVETTHQSPGHVIDNSVISKGGRNSPQRIPSLLRQTAPRPEVVAPPAPVHNTVYNTVYSSNFQENAHTFINHYQPPQVTTQQFRKRQAAPQLSFQSPRNFYDNYLDEGEKVKETNPLFRPTIFNIPKKPPSEPRAILYEPV